MMIDANLLPFSVDELVKSKAWHDATPEQRRKFISAGVTFDSVLTHYADKYRAKKTIKGEFISCVLWDFYYDLFCNPIEQGNGFDFELGYYYENNIDNYSERLLDEAIDPKRWIKVLKQAYREDKEKIIEGATDKNGNIDLDLINDFSVEYRDYLYQRKEILGVWNKMEILLSELIQEEIQEIIDNSNHTNYESIKEFHDDGLLEVFPSAEDVWPGYDDDEKLPLSTGKVVLFIGG